jgi:hypothetical protein
MYLCLGNMKVLACCQQLMDFLRDLVRMPTPYSCPEVWKYVGMYDIDCILEHALVK